MKNWIKSLVLLAVGAWFLTGCAVYETEKKSSCGSTKAFGAAFSGSINPDIKCEKPVRETTTTTTTTSKPQSKLETSDEPAEERREDRGETMVEADNGPDNRSDQANAAPVESSEQPVITEDKEVVRSDDGTTTTTTTVVTKEFAQAAPPAPEVVRTGYSYSGGYSYSAPVYYTEYSNGYYRHPETLVWFHWEWDSPEHHYHRMMPCERPSFYVYETGRCVERGEGNQWLHHNSRRPPERHVAERAAERDNRTSDHVGSRTGTRSSGSAAPTEHRGVDGMRSSSSTPQGERNRPVASGRGHDEDRGDRNGRTTHTTTHTEYRTNTGCADCDQQDRVNNQRGQRDGQGSGQRDQHDQRDNGGNRDSGRNTVHSQPGQTPIYHYDNRGNGQGGDRRDNGSQYGGDNNRGQGGNRGGGSGQSGGQGGHHG